MKTPPKPPPPTDDDAPEALDHDEAPTEPSEPDPEFRVSTAVPYVRWSDAALLVRVHEARPESGGRFRVDFVMRED